MPKFWEYVKACRPGIHFNTHEESDTNNLERIKAKNIPHLIVEGHILEWSGNPLEMPSKAEIIAKKVELDALEVPQPLE